MAISRHPRPQLFRRVVLDRPPELAREVVRDDDLSVPSPVAVVERRHRVLERPTQPIVRRPVITRTR